VNLYWPEPNKVGIAFFVIFAILLLYIFSHFFMTPCHWFWYFILVALPLVSYPIFMILGRNIGNRRKLKDGLVGKDITTKNKKLEWICFIAFLIFVAIPLNLGCFLLSSYFSYWDRPPPIYILVVYWSIYILPIVLAIVLMILRWNTTFIIFLTSVILLERFCAGLAFHTIGGIESFLYYSVICLNIIPIILYAVKFKRTAVALILLLSLWLVPEQLYLGYRYIQLQDEAHAIVEYVYKTKVQTGSYPQDLSGYKFKNPHLKKHIQEYRAEDDDFRLRYYVGTTSTSHSYSPEGGWFYYPD